MAKATLPVNYKDDILASSMGGKRRYRMINNTDGTVSFEDATTYTQVGSDFGAADINKTNAGVNAAADASRIIDNIDDIMSNTQPGYMAGALSLKKINSDLAALNDGGAITGMDAREDGVYITYIPSTGADAVTKKLGDPEIATKTFAVNIPTKTPGGGTVVNITLDGYVPKYAGITSLHYTAAANDNAQDVYLHFSISGNTITFYSTSNHTVGWDAWSQVNFIVVYQAE